MSQNTANNPLRLAGASIDRSATPVPCVLHARVVAGTGGGPEKTIFSSARFADPAAMRIAALYIHPAKDPGVSAIRDMATRLGCPLFQLEESGPLDPRTVRDALQLCKTLRVTVWHGHDYKSNALGVLLRRFWPMRLVTTLHGWTHETARTRLYYHVDNLAIRFYERVFAVSPKLADHCRRLGVPADRVTLLPNGIDTEEFRRQRTTAEARELFGIAKDRLVLGVVGRLSAEKGVARAVRVAARLAEQFPKLELHLIGDGPERAAIRRLADELAVADRVRFWGWQANAKPHFETMDLLLLPSYTEGLPNAVLEAMAMGVCVASTDVGGVRDLLKNGACGELLEQDEAKWIGRLVPLLSSRSKREAFAKRARARIERKYTLAARMTGEMSVYERLIAPTVHGERKAA